MNSLQNFVNRIKLWIFSELENRRYVLLHYNVPGKKGVFDQIRKIRRERTMLSLSVEAMQIYMLVKNTSKVPGDIAEVGAFQGATAKIISLVKGNKTLHLFDTFEGLPTPIKDDDKGLKKGMFLSPLASVKKYLSTNKHIRFYKGIFPSTSSPIKSKKFSFVNLDTDLYEGTYQSLEFFYPRMSKGGIIVTHDYAIYGGVRKAFDLFFKDKPEPIIELTGTQGMIVKC